MKRKYYKVEATIWQYPGMEAWHFVTIPKPIAKQIREDDTKPRKGWGSIKIVATLGKTTWKTSIFPNKHKGGSILPIKAEVRKKEDVGQGDKITFSVCIE